jgi:alpha-glucoside PTS system EIICB component
MMKAVQRFGGAMYVPVMLFSFAGIVVGLTILLQNPQIMGNLADPDGLLYKFSYIIQEGGWTVFRQMPILFAIGIPIALAKTAQARACMESLVVYLTFNYFVSAILTLWGNKFRVDMNADIGGVSGLTEIAGIKTLDTSIIGSILVSCIVVYIHNRYFDKKLPDFLGIFQGSTYVFFISFFVMLPLAFIVTFIWPIIQGGIASLQGILVSSGVFGVGLYTFLERALIPTGLHHFVYTPFIYGPAIVNGGINTYWIEHLNQYASSALSLKELFPQGGFALHGNSKIFGVLGIALAIYATAKPEKKKVVAGLLIPATLTAVVAGITEPIEFTFLFISPVLFIVHAFLAGIMAATMYAFGIVGNMGGGMIEMATQNWIPLFHNHWMTYVTQWMIGLSFTAIYFFMFRYLIVKLNVATPGREKENGTDAKLYTKKDYKAQKQHGSNKNAAPTDAYSNQALLVLEALGGADNIADVTNCATRLRVSVIDETKVQTDATFRASGAHGIVRKGTAIQVIIGLSVPQVRERVERFITKTNAQ